MDLEPVPIVDIVDGKGVQLSPQIYKDILLLLEFVLGLGARNVTSS